MLGAQVKRSGSRLVQFPREWSLEKKKKERRKKEKKERKASFTGVGACREFRPRAGKVRDH